MRLGGTKGWAEILKSQYLKHMHEKQKTVSLHRLLLFMKQVPLSIGA
jgi:hypothetical protein